ncbi:MAG TPA: hypothetical protein VMS08_03700 [Candidatus Saccharimonadia bacterium]|nr:hypothetical protein [Candidatus Saccharimonadia bacterium]
MSKRFRPRRGRLAALVLSAAIAALGSAAATPALASTHAVALQAASASQAAPVAVTAPTAPKVTTNQANLAGPDFSSATLVLKSKAGECINTHGVGNQVTIATSNCASFASQAVDFDGNSVMALTDGSGNCLKATDDHNVVIGSGACNDSDSISLWFSQDGASNSGPGPYENWGTGGLMATDCSGSGCYVFTTNASGTWRIVEG